MPNKNVVFDIVGTLVAYDHLFEAIEARFGAERLRAANINAQLLGYCWIEAAEREYTYLSLSGRYRPFFELFESLFYRMLSYAGVADPHAFATPADVDYLVTEWKKLGLRPGAADCVATLRAAGFTVWCLTAADTARVQGYFAAAGVDMPADHLVSCDATQAAKPQPAAYAPLLARLTAADGTRPWFAAAHMWDVSTARTVGFRGAYCTILESDPLHNIYGDMDVVDATLVGMAEKIIATTQ